MLDFYAGNAHAAIMKICTKCKTEKPLTEFHKMKSGKDGLASQCSKCAIEYQHKNRAKNGDKINESRRRKRAENLNEARRRDRERYAANSEVKKAQTRNRRKDNPELLSAQARKRRADNPDKFAAQQKAYYAANPEMIEMRNVLKRAERGNKSSLEIFGLPTKEAVRDLRIGKLAIYNKYFNGVKCHLDHMEPISSARGNIDELHNRSHFTNLVYIPFLVNHSKGAKPFLEWFATLTDENLKKCIAEQDAYNKRIHRELNEND